MKKTLFGLCLLALLCAALAQAADPDEFSVNGAPGVAVESDSGSSTAWHQEDGTWTNGDNSQRFPSFEDVLDFFSSLWCGYYGCWRD